MKFTNTSIPGVIIIECKRFEDERGTFVKTFHREIFAAEGISFAPCEEFYSSSKKGVLRGMHFQKPPAQHAKLVTCLSGAFLDVVVDLRRGSSTFGHYETVELSGNNHRALFIPEGLAHGFLALEDQSLMYYAVTSVHSPEQDAGILWSSFGLAWPVEQPVLSARDAAFPPLSELESPFS